MNLLSPKHDIQQLSQAMLNPGLKQALSLMMSKSIHIELNKTSQDPYAKLLSHIHFANAGVKVDKNLFLTNSIIKKKNHIQLAKTININYTFVELQCSRMLAQ